jgi:hypothetical protein
MVESWITGMPYQWLVDHAQSNIDQTRRRGGGYVGLATLAERLVRTHRPVNRRVGSPCRACGYPWPCDAFAVAWVSV